MSVSIIIINYRTPHVTLGCLESLSHVREEIAGMKVVLIDNASNDGSDQLIQKRITESNWGAWIHFVKSNTNRGFAGGNNLGIRIAFEKFPEVPYILLLNSDTIVHPGALASCHNTMEQDKALGAMSCRLLNSDGSIQNVTRRFPSPLFQTLCSIGLPWKWPKLFGWANVNEVAAPLLTQARTCDWIGGAFMFIRRTALERTGLLDESFFFYGEDIEFCYRFRKAGFRIYYDPATAVTHLGGCSSDPTRLEARMRNRHMWQARYLVQKQCYGTLAACWIRAVDVLVFAARKLTLLLRGKRDSSEYRRASDVLSLLVRKLDPK